VRLREPQTGQLFAWQRSGEANLGLSTFPVGARGIRQGPCPGARGAEARPALDHPSARRLSIAARDVACVSIVEHYVTFQEGLTLVGAGRRILVVGAHARPLVRPAPWRLRPRQPRPRTGVEPDLA